MMLVILSHITCMCILVFYRCINRRKWVILIVWLTLLNQTLQLLIWAWFYIWKQRRPDDVCLFIISKDIIDFLEQKPMRMQCKELLTCIFLYYRACWMNLNLSELNLSFFFRVCSKFYVSKTYYFTQFKFHEETNTVIWQLFNNN